MRWLRHKLRGPWRHRVRGWRHRIANRGLAGDVFQVMDGPRLVIAPPARRAFNFFAVHDPSMTEEMRSFLRLTRSRRCLVDVGAHYGLFSLVFASRPGATAVAVEPSPSALVVLEHHCGANPDLRITVAPVAMGAEPGEMHVAIDVEGQATRSTAGSLAVPVMTLDDLADAHGIRPDALKIDVEGMELEVLLGAAKTLALRPVVFLEVHPRDLAAVGAGVREIEQLLRGAGYSLLDSRGRAITDLDTFCGGAVSRVVAS